MVQEQFECEHCGTVFSSAYAWEMHIMMECDKAPREHKEWIAGIEQ